MATSISTAYLFGNIKTSEATDSKQYCDHINIIMLLQMISEKQIYSTYYRLSSEDAGGSSTEFCKGSVLIHATHICHSFPPC